MDGGVEAMLANMLAGGLGGLGTAGPPGSRAGVPPARGRGGAGGGAAPKVPDMAALLSAFKSDGTPDFDKIAAMSGLDPNALKGQVKGLWSHMDDLAEKDPEEYKKFLAKQATEAGMDPALMGVGGGPGGGGGKLYGETGATFLMPAAVTGASEGVGVVAVWRASSNVDALAGDDDAPVKVRARAAPRVEKVPFPDPRENGALDGAQTVKIGGANGLTPPPLDAVVYDLDAHPDAIARALEDSDFQATLIERATAFVEGENDGVTFDRRHRRCYTHRMDASAETAAAAAAADAKRGGIGGDMSSALLTEIAGMSAADGARGKRGAAAAAAAAKTIVGGSGAAPAAPPPSAKRSLIEEVKASEVKASHSVDVERDAAGLPIAVEVTVRLPMLRSMSDAALEVSDRYVHVTPGAGEDEIVIALPVRVDADSMRAKFKKKEKKLTLRGSPMP
jgi:hypothetical protein